MRDPGKARKWPEMPRFPSMDASRPARGFVASGVRVSAAAIHPVSTAAGPDEFRGPAPDHKRGLFRPRQATGSADPGPTAHAILDYRPRSPWKPFTEGPARRLGAAGDRPSRNHAHAAVAQ